jgi:hypothetical protein
MQEKVPGKTDRADGLLERNRRLNHFAVDNLSFSESLQKKIPQAQFAEFSGGRKPPSFSQVFCFSKKAEGKSLKSADCLFI